MLITMSEKDIYRFKVLPDVREKRLRQVDAAAILNVSARHIRRLLNRFSTLGAQGLAYAARASFYALSLWLPLSQDAGVVWILNLYISARPGKNPESITYRKDSLLIGVLFVLQ